MKIIKDKKIKIEIEINEQDYKKIMEKLISTPGALWILDLIQKGIK